MPPELDAANAWLKTEHGAATLYNAGPFAKPLLVRAFVAGWKAKEATDADAERLAGEIVERQMEQREGEPT